MAKSRTPPGLFNAVVFVLFGVALVVLGVVGLLTGERGIGLLLLVLGPLAMVIGVGFYIALVRYGRKPPA